MSLLVLYKNFYINIKRIVIRREVFKKNEGQFTGTNNADKI